MSKLAAALSNADIAPAERIRKGPLGECGKVYPAGDMDDWHEVERIRHLPRSSWREAQRVVDVNLGITDPIDNDKFRYHWRRRCFCWPPELRLP